MDPQNLPIVVTDSASQLVQADVLPFGIEVVPLEIYINGKEYLDGLEITPGELYKKMRTENPEVKTSAPGVGRFYSVFKKMIDQGRNEILCITISNKLSATYNAAVDAANMIQAEYSEKKVIVFDSLTAAVAQGFLALEAAKRLSTGESMEKVIRFLTLARERTGLIAAVETLKYLAQGGRIGKASYLVGNALRIVPVLTVNREGVVAPVAKVRRKDNLLPNMLSILNQHIKGWKKIHLSVMHADAMEQAKGLQKALSDLYPSLEVPIEPFTPVMGAHTGPGLFGMGYYFE
ncbi:MAG TPA: DegV family protein [Anaerolineaceae bacterium]|nr:DegV family protein [Anaerolineaceae bacterium]